MTSVLTNEYPPIGEWTISLWNFWSLCATNVHRKICTPVTKDNFGMLPI